MDEYLSKPLQQNHLIQTILKCVTLGGPLLERSRDHDLAMQMQVGRKSGRHDEEFMLPPPTRPSYFDTATVSIRKSLIGTSSISNPSQSRGDTGAPQERVRADSSDEPEVSN